MDEKPLPHTGGIPRRLPQCGPVLLVSPVIATHGGIGVVPAGGAQSDCLSPCRICFVLRLHAGCLRAGASHYREPAYCLALRAGLYAASDPWLRNLRRGLHARTFVHALLLCLRASFRSLPSNKVHYFLSPFIGALCFHPPVKGDGSRIADDAAGDLVSSSPWGARKRLV